MEDQVKNVRHIPRIDIYRAWCKGCGICAAFCPAGVLGRDEQGYPCVKEPGKCLGCGWCEIHCPDFAIAVTKKGDDGDGGEREEASSAEGAGEDIEKED